MIINIEEVLIYCFFKTKYTIIFNKKTKEKKMKLKIREALSMANTGATKDNIKEHFGIKSEEEYRREISSFSDRNRKRLNSLINKNNNVLKKQILIEKKSETQIIVLDTSYLLNKACKYEKLNNNCIILSSVYEQLIYQEKVLKNRMVCKLFHMILSSKCEVSFIKESYVPKLVVDYEDPADMEIIEFAKNNKNVIVYTADKALAIRCKQQGIKYKFFNSNL